ncbi:MAG: MoaD/ThiS family protein [Pseudonocardiaceae bacterium]|nr:MoaD/ThiS family protein [Pseudonocardiaceae bacterium]
MTHETEATAVRVTVRYFAAARAAAGTDTERIELPAEASVRDVLTVVRARHSTGLARVLDAASYLLDGVAVRDHDTAISDQSQLDVLPPFAGG